METSEAGFVYIFYSLFIIWATDSGAYFIGKALGKENFGQKLVLIKQLKVHWWNYLCSYCQYYLWLIYRN